ncbi:MAG: DUF378 domain-containing protein [Chlamydiae bacterium]|jgi:uncharacterized membrane protein YuzA (DUF378 family)|nr:DUF378 domain-containing protein [Chlamydiota bacterium]
MKTLDVIAAILLVIGGLNWGLVGLADFNLVTYVFGEMLILSRIIFVIVGLAALYQIFQWKAIQTRWK